MTKSRSIFRILAVLVAVRFPHHVASADLATEVEVEELYTGLGDITDIQSTPIPNDERLFVATRSGQIKIVDMFNGVLPTPFLDISSIITRGGERGLLGMAFHPNYNLNGYFFVHYSAESTGNSILTRYSVSTTDSSVANASSQLVIANIDQPYANHNGGQIQFGPSDGYLYMALGDGGSANDPALSGQNMTSYLGKLLRVDIDNMVATSLPLWNIPPSNPFASECKRRFTSHLGIRIAQPLEVLL